MRNFKYLSLAAALAAPGANAFQLDLGQTSNWSGALDSIATYTAMWRLEGAKDELGTDVNNNDSDLNFGSGLVSNGIRIISDLEIKYSADNGNSYGLFSRFTAYYDDEVYEGDTDYQAVVRTGTSVNGLVTYTQAFDSFNNSTTYGGTTEPGKFTDKTDDRIGFGKDLLDLFVFASIAPNSDHPVTLRVGRQIINWGESAFIQNGISAVMNYADVNKALIPAFEVKEILRPLGSIYGSVGLSENLTLQAYYQYEWNEYLIPACGNYLNPAPDFVCEGGENLLVPLDVLAEFVRFRGDTLPVPFSLQDANLFSVSHVAVERLADIEAKDDGQWGIALTWFVPDLNDTEFGFYVLNYHRKLPDFIARPNGGTTLRNYPDLGLPAPLNGSAFPSYFSDCGRHDIITVVDCAGLGLLIDYIDNATLQAIYYEDVSLYGFSWNTVIGWTDTAWSGEIAWHHDIPVQTVHALQGLLEDGVIACDLDVTANCSQKTELSSREDVVVVQMYIFHDFNNFTFADEVGLIAEVGWIHAVDLDDGFYHTPFTATTPGELAYLTNAADGTVVPGARIGFTDVNGVSTFDSLSSQGGRDTLWMGTAPASKDSWGYQAWFLFTYFNGVGEVFPALTGTDLTINFNVRHDVEGLSPIPGTGFAEGYKAVSVSADASWQNTWVVTVSYTNFFGSGTNSFGVEIDDNPVGDRDFVSLAVKYAF
ncbi:MAG: DUF1302 family protein [Pseudomonadales bacterium]